MCADVTALTYLIDDEVIRAMGLPVEGWSARYLHSIVGRATRRFSVLFAEVDRIVAEHGLPAGARWLLLKLVADFRVRGAENVPPVGPLIIASNHPGAVDSVALATTAGRSDLKIIASAVPFLRNLPHVGEHLIFLPRDDVRERMLVVRESIRHLQTGGALLLFARGSIDPDPAFMPEAEQELSAWSRSLEIFLRNVPQTQVVASIVSHVVQPTYMRHPLVWLRRTRIDRQRLAMMIQIIQEMLGKQLNLVPRVSFGPVLNTWKEGTAQNALQAIIASAESLMRSHLAWHA